MIVAMRTAKLEKRNPLPPGRYWIDVFPDGIATWVGWSGGNLATVGVEKTEFYKGTTKVQTILGWAYPWVPEPGVWPPQFDHTSVPDRAFIIFTVSSPTTWDIDVQKVLGWPNTAPTSIQTSDDTSTKPAPAGWFDNLSPGLKITVGGIGLAAVVLGGAYVFRSFK